ncbi:flagellar hook-length control protein FliK [Paenibacillus sp. CAU 1782]
MDILVAGTNVSPSSGGTSPVASVKPTAGAEGAAGFQTVLVKQMGGQAEAQEQNSAPVALVGSVSAQSQDGSSLTELPELEQLLALMDSLIDQLDAKPEEGSPEPELNQEELLSALEGMQALLILLGLPAVHLQQAANEASNAAASVEEAGSATLALKSNLQDALLQMQTVLQQGSQKQVQGQEPVALVAKQLGELAALLKGEASPASQQSTQKEASQTPAWINSASIAAKDASSFLQRMSQQAVHPSILAAAVQNGELATQADAGLQAQGDLVAASPVSLLAQQTVREHVPMPAASQTASTFVLAEDFAETMRGMIVQKFDIRTMNGASEARLTLFPEHLGGVDVRISMQGGVLTAVFMTDTAQAKDMLENQMAQLRSALQAQGLNVDKLEVTQSESASVLQGQNGQEQGNRNPFRNSQNQQEDDRVTDNAFEAEVAEQAAIQGLGFGRSINETA